jgi:uncharacterized membrane protein (UPF0182 family)
VKKTLIKILIGVIVLLVLVGVFSSFFVDYQWFNEVGYIDVFFTSLKSKAIIFGPTFVVLFLLILVYSRYLKKGYLSMNNQVYDKKETSLHNKIIFFASLVLSLIFSLLFTEVFWYRILEYFNATDFGIKDPLFGYDAGFYIFKLPLINAVLGVLITIIVLLIIATLVFYSLLKIKDGFTGFKEYMKAGDSREASFAIKQLSVLGAILLILLAGAFYLRGLNLVYSPRGIAFGGSYTDVHISLPMFKIIAVLCLISAFIVFFAIIRKRTRWVVYTAIFIAVLMVSETLVSGIVERFIVAPNARDKELPYLTYNIDMTRKGFGLENIKETPFTVDNTLAQKDIDENMDTIDNIRINEFSQSLEVFNQIQAIRNYYKFNDVDIDRYDIDGKTRQVFISARELDNSRREAKFQTWQNLHLYYTHGYGAVMSYTNDVNASGLPEFILKDIPTLNTEIKIDVPQIYFGELDYDYVVVGKKNQEIDYPAEDREAKTTYSGTAGIKMTPLNKLLFAFNKGSINFLLSNDVTADSKIILNRNIVDRVKKIAPFISYDSDPYLVISNGKLYWIIDAYTTSNRFPYAEQYNGINYVRNSVKVVIDAYDGKVDFYLADSSDAIAKTIGKIYSGIFKDISQMPEDLKNHLRYSEDVFMTQSKVYEKYHMNNPAVFYNSEDLWSVAKKKANETTEADVEAVYQVMRLPGETKEELLLTIPFTVAKKENMVSWLAVKMDADNLSQMTLVKFPKEKSIYGPQQFNSRLNTDTEISRQIALWDQKGSQVILGETNIIPVKNALLYVKPLYLRANSGNSLPELKKVIIGLGEKIVMEDNIQLAFAKLFNANIEQPGTTTPTPTETTPGAEVDINSLIIKAADLYEKSKQAQQSGDWAGYGEYIKELESVLNQLKNNAQL